MTIIFYVKKKELSLTIKSYY